MSEQIIKEHEKEICELKKRVGMLEKVQKIKSDNPPMDIIETEPGTMVKIGYIKPDVLGKLGWYAYALEALEILFGSGIVDNEVCVIDKRGFCQTHGFQESPCPIARARELLDNFRRDVKNMTRVRKEAAGANSLPKKEVC